MSRCPLLHARHLLHTMSNFQYEIPKLILPPTLRKEQLSRPSFAITNHGYNIAPSRCRRPVSRHKAGYTATRTLRKFLHQRHSAPDLFVWRVSRGFGTWRIKSAMFWAWRIDWDDFLCAFFFQAHSQFVICATKQLPYFFLAQS